MISALAANSLTKENIKSEELQNHLESFEKQIRKCALKGRYSAMWCFNKRYSQEFIDAFTEEVADAGYKIREHRYNWGETQIFVFWDDSVEFVKDGSKKIEKAKQSLSEKCFTDAISRFNKDSSGSVEDLDTGKSTNGVTL